jgi:membrane protease YdiL (CAAX protease family)
MGALADALVDELNRYEEGGGRAALDEVLRREPYLTVLDEPSSDLGLRRPGGRWAVVLDDGIEVVVVVGPPGRPWRRGRVTEVASDAVRSRLVDRERPAPQTSESPPFWPPPPGGPDSWGSFGTTHPPTPVFAPDEMWPPPPGVAAPQPVDPGPPVLVGPSVWRLLGINLLAQVAAVALSVAVSLTGSDPATLLAGEVGFAGVLGLACYRIGRRNGGQWLDALGVRFKWRDIPLGLVLIFGINQVVNVLVSPLLPDDPDKLRTNTEVILDSQHTVVGTVVIVAVVVLMAPIVEELFFRGLLLRTLSARMPWMWANVVQAGLFTIQHLGVDATSTENLITAINIGVVGLVFGYIATTQRRLGPTMVAHFVMNASALAITAALR